MTAHEKKIVKELYADRAERMDKMHSLLKNEFGIPLSTTLINRIIFRFSDAVKKKRKEVQRARRPREVADQWKRERQEGVKTKRGTHPKHIRGIVKQYDPEKHGVPSFHGNPLHNQQAVKKCPVCGRLYHPIAGWEDVEAYCSFVCQEEQESK